MHGGHRQGMPDALSDDKGSYPTATESDTGKTSAA